MKEVLPLKEGLYYRDKRTNEILLCHLFTRSYHVFINHNNVYIERAKYNVYERVTSKKAIQEFEEMRKGKPRKDVREDYIHGWDNVMNFNTIYN